MARARGTTTESSVDDVVDDVDETTTPDPDHINTFEEAFALAKAKHSGDPEQAPDDEASTQDDEDEDGTPPARKGQAEPAPLATADKPDPKAQTGLLSDDEFASLQATHKDDPAALRKALEGAFTKKTQALAAERRSTERLAQYVDIIDAYEADAEGTVRELAKQLGLTIATPGETTATTAEETATTVDDVMAEFKAGLGPELEYLADTLGPAITKIVERLTNTNVEKATKPLKDAQQSILERHAAEATDTVMKSFGEKHPDWKQHEDAMFALSQKLQPGKGMTEIDYLEHLYDTVSAPTKAATSEKDLEKKVAAGVKAAIERLNKGAEDAETKDSPTPERLVRKARPPNASFEDAYNAAKRGEVWTD